MKYILALITASIIFGVFAFFTIFLNFNTINNLKMASPFDIKIADHLNQVFKIRGAHKANFIIESITDCNESQNNCHIFFAKPFEQSNYYKKILYETEYSQPIIERSIDCQKFTNKTCIYLATNIPKNLILNNFNIKVHGENLCNQKIIKDGSELGNIFYNEKFVNQLNCKNMSYEIYISFGNGESILIEGKN